MLEDNLYFLLNYYKKLPDWVKQMVSIPVKVIPRRNLLGKKYDMFFREAQEMEYKTKEELEEYHWQKISELLKYCFNYVPFYKSLWDEYGIKLKQIQNLDDFEKIIPYTNKTDIQAHPEKFVSEKIPRKELFSSNTGGSTGVPLTIYMLKSYTRAAENAHMHFLWSKMGFNFGDRVARLRGDYIGKSRLYSYDPWRNMLILSSFSLANENFQEYFRLINIYNVKYINAYPSTLFQLIQLAKEKQYKCQSLKGIFLGSENIFDWQVKEIESYFGVKVYYWYGHGELCALGGKCEKSNSYHFMPSYGYVEFESDVSISNDISEIIATTYINPAMPLVRYRTQDYAEYTNSKCSKCGSNHLTAQRIIGREQDIAIGINGEKITLTALVFGRHSKYFDHISKMQIVNKAPGKLVVRIIPKASFESSHKIEIINSLSLKEGMPFETSIEVVNNMETSPRGKHKFLIKDFS